MPEDDVPLALPLGDNGNGVDDPPPHADNGDADLQEPPAHGNGQVFSVFSPVLDPAAAANLAAAAGNDGDQELFLRDDGTTSPEPDTDC